MSSVAHPPDGEGSVVGDRAVAAQDRMGVYTLVNYLFLHFGDLLVKKKIQSQGKF